MSIKKFIRETFRSCLDILRTEHLTGDKALRPLGYFLQLRLIESQFGKEIDIDNPIYYNFRHYEFADNKERCDDHLAQLLRIARFSYLAKVKEDNLKMNLEYLWDDILSVHPATKDVFLKGRGFHLKKQSTYKKIIDKLAAVDFENIDEDILGEVYEEVIKDTMTGKTLGQFFTPPVVKQMMVDLINPQIHPDGTTESIFDPSMGTGGLLITCLRSLISKSKEAGVKIKWDILTKNRMISGRECEPDTFQLAVSNMLISSGKMFHVEYGDSIYDPITTKHDIIIANPPFGIKGLEYDEITSPLRNTYLPIRSKSSTPLFLQAIIYMLKVNGRCAVVLPDGQDLFSTTKSLIAVRKYLMKTCDLKEVIYLPPGMFTHTTIKTCVFYFYKKKEGSEVLELKLKYSDAKEIDRSYVFTEAHQTEKVVFSEFDGTAKRVLVEVSIADIATNNYSLNFSEYLEKTNSAIKIGGGSGEDGIVVKTLGEICKFLPKSKRSASYGKSVGQYPFFKSSLNVTHFVDEPDFTEESIIVGDGGEPNVNYGTKFSVSDHCYVLQNKAKERVNLRYVYFYCFYNLSTIGELFTGVAIKNISKSRIETIQIPIPSLEKQQEIIDHIERHQECYSMYHRINQEKLQTIKHMNELRFQRLVVFGAAVKTLGEICKFLPKSKRSASYGKSVGQYPFFKSSLNVTHFVDEPDFTEESIILGDGGEPNVNYGTKFSVSDHCYVLQNKAKERVNLRYVYFYCYNNLKTIGELFTGVAIKNISKSRIETIQIPIPSLEKQQEIVEFCEINERLIKQVEKEIEQNGNLSQTLIHNAFAGLKTADETKKRKHGDV